MDDDHFAREPRQEQRFAADESKSAGQRQPGRQEEEEDESGALGATHGRQSLPEKLAHRDGRLVLGSGFAGSVQRSSPLARGICVRSRVVGPRCDR